MLIDGNKAAEKLVGYSKADLAGKSLFESKLLPPDQIPIALGLLERNRRGEATGPDEIRLLRKDGSSVLVEIRTYPVRITGQDVVLACIHDLSLRLQARQQLLESDRRLRELLENVHLIAMTLDAGGRITFCNPYLLQLTGWSEEEVFGKSWFDCFIPKEDRAAIVAVFDVGIRTSAFPIHHENAIVTRAGARRTISWDNTLLRDVTGAIVGCASIGRDVTDQLLLEEQYRQAQKLESVGRLAGGVAHDFNNLLTVINGYSEILLEKLNPEDPIAGDIRNIRTAGERATALSRQLLALSRKQIVETRALNLNRVIDDFDGMLQRLIGEDVILVIQKHPSLPLVEADEGQLQQVLMNLVVNARDAMPQGGTLTLRTAVTELSGNGPQAFQTLTPGRYVLLEVADTGIGMSEETKAHLFEPFFTTKEKGVGTGLGLATVYGIITQAGGRIDVDSELVKGSRFTICLPESVASPPAEEAPPLPRAAASGGHETILLVEDNESVLRMAAHVLRGYGYTVLEAADAEQALGLAGNFSAPIHLLVTDVVLPGKNGRELAGKLLESRPSTKVLFISGYTDDILGRHGVLDPGVVCLPKPFTPEALGAKVRSILDVPTPGTVLVVDDEESVRGLLRQILEAAGYQVLEAANGNQALARLKDTRVDLVITDLAMPEKEGMETIQELARLEPRPKIIAMSGAFGAPILKISRKLGAHAALAKPIRPDELLETVRAVLRP